MSTTATARGNAADVRAPTGSNWGRTAGGVSPRVQVLTELVIAHRLSEYSSWWGSSACDQRGQQTGSSRTKLNASPHRRSRKDELFTD